MTDQNAAQPNAAARAAQETAAPKKETAAPKKKGVDWAELGQSVGGIAQDATAAARQAARDAASAAAENMSRARILRVARKEVSGSFASLAAYIFIGVYVAASLLAVFWVERFFARNIADLRPLFEWTPALLIFLVAALTMRMWSEERRSGALEFLMTTPARPLELVLGKFLACMALVGAALALTTPLVVVVAVLGPLDWGPVFGGYLATLCLAAAYISIGLFVSSRTESQIVSLIVTALICGAFYLIGSPGLTALFGADTAETLRQFGSGSRFDSITRGVIDVRDLYYYVSIFGVFTALNLYSLESLRWADGGGRPRHQRWRLLAALAVANLAAANLWLGQLTWARVDLTAGGVYSLSDTTERTLAQAEEPILIRGYFTEETHPLLAPLAPRMKDLLAEYEIAGDGRVRLEILDPLSDPALEEEASRRYGLRPASFQTASRYQAGVASAYFDVIVQIGDVFETISYGDLIDVKAGAGGAPEVDLQNPEYEITRAVRRALSSYRAGGDVYASLPNDVRLTAYVSADATLPEPLPELKAQIAALFERYGADSGGRVTGAILDPTAGDGAVAAQLEQTYGLRPLAVGLFGDASFWFHIVMDTGDGRLLQVPLPDPLEGEALERVIDGELRRLTPGALRRIGLAAPRPDPQMAQFGLPPATLNFAQLQATLGESFEVLEADLETGFAPDGVDALIVAAPEALSDIELFAIDQFLMRGGAVVLSTGPVAPEFGQQWRLAAQDSGLADWLAHHGVTISEAMVVDPQSAPALGPAPGASVEQRLAIYEFFPPFVDVRADGLIGGSAPTAGLGQLTLPWAGAITLATDRLDGLRAVQMVRSSPAARLTEARAFAPDFDAHPDLGFPTDPETAGRKILAVAIERASGEDAMGFASFFAGRASPLADGAATALGAEDAQSDGTNEAAAPDAAAAGSATARAAVIERSAESARLIVIASASALSDEALQLLSAIDRSEYGAPLSLAANAVDWALEDRALLRLRGQPGRFARRLAPVSAAGRAVWETSVYGLALLGLIGVYAVRRVALRRASARRAALLAAKA